MVKPSPKFRTIDGKKYYLVGDQFFKGEFARKKGDRQIKISYPTISWWGLYRKVRRKK